MGIKRLKLNNFTVFDKLDVEFTKGVNIIIGENGTGKTHILKVMYAACQAIRKDIMFSHKIVKVFRPDDFNINRLVKRGKGMDGTQIEVTSQTSTIKAKFSTKTKKWEADVTGENLWEKNNEDLISNFIPAKEILSNAYQFEAAYIKDMIDFDETYLDIVATARIDINRGEVPSSRKRYLDRLKEIMKGSIAINNEKFYLKSGSQSTLEFQLVAEGLRKLGLLWQLIKNGSLEKGSILFWDEPEANLNPIVIPVLVEILLELQREGVQVFISTHDYILAKYFEVRSRKDDALAYYSLYRDEDFLIKCDQSNTFRNLKNNPIITAFDALLEEVLDKNMGD